MSDDAGRFVCNYLYFCSLANGVPCVFVHVPPVERVPLEAQMETLSKLRGYLVEAVGNNAVDVLADVAAVANGAGIVDQLVARASHAALGGGRRADASVMSSGPGPANGGRCCCHAARRLLGASRRRAAGGPPALPRRGRGADRGRAGHGDDGPRRGAGRGLARGCDDHGAVVVAPVICCAKKTLTKLVPSGGGRPRDAIGIPDLRTPLLASSTRRRLITCARSSPRSRAPRPSS